MRPETAHQKIEKSVNLLQKADKNLKDEDVGMIWYRGRMFAPKPKGTNDKRKG